MHNFQTKSIKPESFKLYVNLQLPEIQKREVNVKTESQGSDSLNDLKMMHKRNGETAKKFFKKQTNM